MDGGTSQPHTTAPSKRFGCHQQNQSLICNLFVCAVVITIIFQFDLSAADVSQNKINFRCFSGVFLRSPIVLQYTAPHSFALIMLIVNLFLARSNPFGLEYKKKKQNVLMRWIE